MAAFFGRIVVLLAYDQDKKTVISGASAEGVNCCGWAWILLSRAEAPVPVQAAGWLFLQRLHPSGDVQAFRQQVSEYTESSFNFTTTPDSVDLTYIVKGRELCNI